MTYIENICRTFNFTYFDFLEDNLFKTHTQKVKDQGKGGLDELQAQMLDNEANLRSDCIEKSPFNEENHPLPKQDFKDSFYLGHFYYKSLWQTPQGQNLVFGILNHRVRKMNGILAHYKELKQEIKNNYDENFSFKNIDEELSNIMKKKLFKTYQDYLNIFNDNHKKNDPKYTQFLNTHKANEEGYINHILSIDSPTQTFYKKKLKV